MNKVTRLVPKGKADYIGELELILEKAKQGEFDNFIFACRRPDGYVQTSWCNTDLSLRSELISHLEMDLVVHTVATTFEEE